MKALKIGVLFLFIFTSINILPTNYAQVQQTYGNGVVNWEKGVLQAIGIGAPPPKAVNAAQKRAMALRAAQADGYRNLLELTKGVRVTSTTTVQNFITKSDQIRLEVNGIIKGAQMVNKKYLSDGSVEVTMQMPIYGYKGISSVIYKAQKKQFGTKAVSKSPAPTPAANTAKLQAEKEAALKARLEAERKAKAAAARAKQEQENVRKEQERVRQEQEKARAAEAARKKAALQEQKLKAERERKKKEEDKRRARELTAQKAREQEQKRLEDVQKRKEQERLAAERKQREAEERARKAKETDERRKAEEAARKAAEEAKRKVAEEKAAEEAARKAQQAEEKRKAEEATQKAREDAERKQKEAELKRIAAERQKAEEAKRRAEAEKRKAEVAKRKAEADEKAAAEEARRKAREAEEKRKAEEAAKKALEKSGSYDAQVGDVSTYTGVIIDSKGTGAKPAMSPKLIILPPPPPEKEVYSMAEADYQVALNVGLVGYASSVDSAKKRPRVGNKPMVIKAMGVKSGKASDVTISYKDGMKLVKLDQTKKVLESCKVVMVLGRKGGKAQIVPVTIQFAWLTDK